MKNLVRWSGVALMFLLLAACSAPQPTGTPIPTATAELTVPTMAPAPSAQGCVDCHTDKNALIANAKIEEEAPEESKGAG